MAAQLKSTQQVSDRCRIQASSCGSEAALRHWAPSSFLIFSISILILSDPEQ